MYDNPGTALLGHLLIPISGSHLLLAEVARLELHMLADGGKVLGEQHALCLLPCVADGVAEQEAALFVGVAVQVEEGQQVAAGLLQ